MNKSRRQFLKVAGLSFLGFASTPVLPALATNSTQYANAKEALTAKRWAMVIDTREFDSPESFNDVIAACHEYHNVPNIENSNQDVKWLWADKYERVFTDQADNFPSEEMTNRKFLLLCNHCENPPCVRVCPTQATFKREDGIVVMDYHRCIGCRFCMAGCPYGARSFNFTEPRPYIKELNPTFPARMRGVVEKCTFCSELLAKGELPRCVEASNGAIVFGDLNDPESEVRQLLAANFTLRRKPTLGTQPGVYYII